MRKRFDPNRNAEGGKYTLRFSQTLARRQEIIQVAARMFSEIPYAEVKMRDVAREASVTTGSIFHKFKSKADLWRTAMGCEPPGEAPSENRLLQAEAILRQFVEAANAGDASAMADALGLAQTHLNGGDVGPLAHRADAAGSSGNLILSAIGSVKAPKSDVAELQRAFSEFIGAVEEFQPTRLRYRPVFERGIYVCGLIYRALLYGIKGKPYRLMPEFFSNQS